MKEENNRSRLVKLKVKNIGCIGDEGVEVALDKIVCLVGKNNSGKSTILRAYELAKGSMPFERNRDRHQHATEDQISEVILDVHIPDGIGNIDAKWKSDINGLRIVRSRWQWDSKTFEKIRTTWNPNTDEGGEGFWDDKNAAGLDSVFSSRLPRPLRIGSLDDAGKTEDMLLTLALTPLIESLELERTNTESQLAKAIASVTEQIDQLSEGHQKVFNDISNQVTTGFQGVFPSLQVQLNIGTAPLAPKVEDIVKKGSGLKIKDGLSLTTLAQQGTGARRALFWAMLQVHNELSREKEIRDEYKKRLEKELSDLKKKPPKEGKASPEEFAVYSDKLQQLEATLAAHKVGAPIPVNPDDPSLPGYLLLIDEPENALHPMASRAAQRHLYKLALSSDWQVMMTTHSPYFINPFADHTTIVRLDRAGAEHPTIGPKTYRSELIEFQGDEKQRLQALQHIDPSFAEVFFGSYPILVEGDTEHAAFIAAVIEKEHELMDRVTIIRARGKAILLPLIKVLKHFKINFGIIHDCDPPFKSDATKNGMWSENQKIRAALVEARSTGIEIRHRISIPDFERLLGGEEESKDKPINAYELIRSNKEAGEFIQKLLSELINSPQHEPFPEDKLKEGVDYLGVLLEEIQMWAKANGMEKNVRYSGLKD